MKKTIFYLVFIFILCFAKNGFSVDIQEWRKIFNDGEFNANSKEMRQIVAQGLLDHITQLNAYIPNLKPVELQWLEQEEKALNKLKGDAWTQKLYQIQWAPETHIQTLKSNLNSVTYSLNEIVSNKTSTLKKEMANWAHVVLIFMNGIYIDESLNVLIKNDRINLTKDIKGKMMLAQDDDLWLLYRVYGQRIQMKMIWSYLKGEVNK